MNAPEALRNALDAAEIKFSGHESRTLVHVKYRSSLKCSARASTRGQGISGPQWVLSSSASCPNLTDALFY